MPQMSMEITLSGLLVMVGQVILFFGFVWKRSGVETEQRGKIESNSNRITALEGTTVGETKRIEAEFDSKVSTLGASINLMRDQHHELREHLATNYMKREEIHAMERRVVEGQTNIMARIDKFETRLDTMQKTILDAITASRVAK